MTNLSRALTPIADELFDGRDTASLEDVKQTFTVDDEGAANFLVDLAAAGLIERSDDGFVRKPAGPTLLGLSRPSGVSRS